ncbi:MAG: 2-oxoisovalerate dehydrogenase [Isosphaeraceae bacterium]
MNQSDAEFDLYLTSNVITELIFIVEEAPEGGYTARALGASIFTEADDWQELQAKLREAVSCHYGEKSSPKPIRLHYVREEVLAL